jgi:hypothetical protein
VNKCLIKTIFGKEIKIFFDVLDAGVELKNHCRRSEVFISGTCTPLIVKLVPFKVEIRGDWQTKKSG